MTVTKTTVEIFFLSWLHVVVVKLINSHHSHTYIFLIIWAHVLSFYMDIFSVCVLHVVPVVFEAVSQNTIKQQRFRSFHCLFVHLCLWCDKWTVVNRLPHSPACLLMHLMLSLCSLEESWRRNLPHYKNDGVWMLCVWVFPVLFHSQKKKKKHACF